MLRTRLKLVEDEVEFLLRARLKVVEDEVEIG